MDQEEIINKAIEHYGISQQKKKVCEELLELNLAVVKKLPRNEIIDEISDVLIVLEYLKKDYYISDEDLKKHITYKLKRLDDRINDEQYENAVKGL